jgi:hypothetical protein
LITLAGTAFARPDSADEPYAPLRLYDGSWQMTPADGKSPKVQIVNKCEKTGLLFVCEQLIDGKTQSLVVFQPTGVTGKTRQYKTLELPIEGKATEWSPLEITGDRWEYSGEGFDNGIKVYWRTINVFSGHDKIHFEIQRSSDGKAWETKQSGEEDRVK